MPDLNLAFPASRIREYAERYSYTCDDCARAAGKRIAKGGYSREDVAAIVEWKTKGRCRSLFKRNTSTQVCTALRRAVEAIANRDDELAMQSLMRLRGVGVPVASTILTFIDPRKYTIIDFRALESLNCLRKGQPSLALYFMYLKRCREIAKENCVSLRVLDKALWQWSYTNRRAH